MGMFIQLGTRSLRRCADHNPCMCPDEWLDTIEDDSCEGLSLSMGPSPICIRPAADAPAAVIRVVRRLPRRMTAAAAAAARAAEALWPVEMLLDMARPAAGRKGGSSSLVPAPDEPAKLAAEHDAADRGILKSVGAPGGFWMIARDPMPRRSRCTAAATESFSSV